MLSYFLKKLLVIIFQATCTLSELRFLYDVQLEVKMIVSHLVLDCPVLDHLRPAIFGHTLSLLDLWSRPWGVARLLGLRGVDPRPHPQEWVG